MAMVKEMMGGGCSAGQARAINGTVSSGVSGAGTTQATATALNAGHNVVTACADGAGVILPACEIGDEIYVFNAVSANNCAVYPDVGSTIAHLATNIAAQLGPNRGAFFKRATSTTWSAVLSA